jgi:glycosyltransferase involved in cell wall biosynthesis
LAFKEIVNEYPAAAFLLAGEGGEKKELEEFVKANGIKRVFFIGGVKYEELAKYINASDACLALFDRTYLTIQKYDYFYSPIKVFDAMGCGKPIIASDIGNLKEIIKENRNGFLVNEQSVEEIREAIRKTFLLGKKTAKIRTNNISGKGEI